MIHLLCGLNLNLTHIIQLTGGNEYSIYASNCEVQDGEIIYHAIYLGQSLELLPLPFSRYSFRHREIVILSAGQVLSSPDIASSIVFLE